MRRPKHCSKVRVSCYLPASSCVCPPWEWMIRVTWIIASSREAYCPHPAWHSFVSMQVFAKVCAGHADAQLVVDIMWQTERENLELLLRALPVLADAWRLFERRVAEPSMAVQAEIQKLESRCRGSRDCAPHRFYDFLDEIGKKFNGQAARAVQSLVATSRFDGWATAEPDEHPHLPSYPLPTWSSLLRSSVAAQNGGEPASAARMTETTPMYDTDSDDTENSTIRGNESPHHLASKIKNGAPEERLMPVYRGLMRVVPCMSPFLLFPSWFCCIRIVSDEGQRRLKQFWFSMCLSTVMPVNMPRRS